MLNLSQIPGLEDVKRILTSSFRENRVPQTQLFINTDGGAGMALAHAFAQYIACHNQGVSACNNCTSCKLFLAHNYPDLIYIFPYIKTGASKTDKKSSVDYNQDFQSLFSQNPFFTIADWHDYIDSGNKQFSIPVNEADYINRVISSRTILSSPRFIILWLPETLTTEAANKLLKTLEEPGIGNYFFLVTTSPERILPTILSRCIICRVPKNKETDVMDFLLLRGLSEDFARFKALSSNGNIGNAISSFVRESTTNEFAENFVGWLRILYSKNIESLVDWCDKTSKLNRVDLIAYLSLSVHFLERAVQLRSGSSQSTIKHGTFDLRQFSQYLKINRGDEIVESLDRAIYDIERNANSKIVLLDLSLRFLKYVG